MADANIVEYITLEDEEEDVKPVIADIQTETLNASQSDESQVILNPAAAKLAKFAESDAPNPEHPNYETNKIIIPRTRDKNAPTGAPADKAKIRSPIRAPNSNKPSTDNKPSFTTKLFSAKAKEEVEGLLGVEYVVKIVNSSSDSSPRYECCLCEVETDELTMQSHLIGYDHRLKFLEKHFPTCIKDLKKYRDDPSMKSVMARFLDKLAKAIESYHGRDIPYNCDESEFRSDRYKIMSKVYSFRHVSERNGMSFTHIIDRATIDQYVAEKETYYVPEKDAKRKSNFDPHNESPPKRLRSDDSHPHRHPSSHQYPRSRPPTDYRNRRNEFSRNNDFYNRNRNFRTGPGMVVEQPGTIDDEEHKRLVEQFLRNTQSKSPVRTHRSSRYHRSRSRSRSPRNRRRSRSPQHPRPRSISPLRDGDVWQAYRHMFDRDLESLDAQYRLYRKDPEMHPDYNAEWNLFWTNRKEELTSLGYDHHNYDFQPEWIKFFVHRLEELYEEAVEDLKIKIRERLVLPMHNDELRDKKYHLKKLQHTVRQEFNLVSHGEEERGRARRSAARENEKTDEKDNESVVNAVSVLRLLTALEDDLGSLGPKAVSLLGKALTLEKSKPGSSNKILTADNCTFLETAKEKLKGLILTGILEGPKVRAIKNVIRDITNLVTTATENRKQSEVIEPVPVPLAPLSSVLSSSASERVPTSVLPSSTVSRIAPKAIVTPPQPVPLPKVPIAEAKLSKQELATKLAAALAAQGKTDFTAEQLEQLVVVYSLMDKKTREAQLDGGQEKHQDAGKKTLSDTLSAFLGESSASNPTGRSSYRTAGSEGSSSRSEQQLATGSLDLARNSSMLNIPQDVLNNFFSSFRGASSTNARNQAHPLPNNQMSDFQSITTNSHQNMVHQPMGNFGFNNFSGTNHPMNNIHGNPFNQQMPQVPGNNIQQNMYGNPNMGPQNQHFNSGHSNHNMGQWNNAPMQQFRNAPMNNNMNNAQLDFDRFLNKNNSSDNMFGGPQRGGNPSGRNGNVSDPFSRPGNATGRNENPSNPFSRSGNALGRNDGPGDAFSHSINVMAVGRTDNELNPFNRAGNAPGRNDNTGDLFTRSGNDMPTPMGRNDTPANPQIRRAGNFNKQNNSGRKANKNPNNTRVTIAKAPWVNKANRKT